MAVDAMDLYRRASEWTLGKVSGAKGKLDASTPCDDWNLEQLLNHMLETQRYFVNSARGEDASLPGPNPSDLLGDDPVADFDRARTETISAFGQPGVIDRTGPALSIAFSDQLLHGWDLARATGQDATMPGDLAQAAYDVVHGSFTDDQRAGVFKPEIEVSAAATAQEKLLAYTGRAPD